MSEEEHEEESLVDNDMVDDYINNNSNTAKWIVGIIIVALIGVIVYFAFFYPGGTESETCGDDVACCIGERSVLYVLPTCSYCARQKELFGDNLDKLNIVDCTENSDECFQQSITSVPTWIIDGESYEGLREIEELQQLTGC